jgi:hypothetical protein
MFLKALSLVALQIVLAILLYRRIQREKELAKSAQLEMLFSLFMLVCFLVDAICFVYLSILSQGQ